MNIFFSLGSLLFGMISWIIPIVAIKQHTKRYKSTFFIYSFTSCAAALTLQLFEIKHLVNLGDFGAIMDTIGTICTISVFLVIVTVAINVVAINLCDIYK